MKLLRFLGRFLLSLLLAILLIVVVLYISGNSYLVKAVQSTYLVGKAGPSIDDYKKFDNREVTANHPISWAKSAHYNQHRLSKQEDSVLNYWASTSFLIIQNDSILFEKYWEPYSESSSTNSFSVAKSFVSLAIGAAIEKGCISSVEQKVGDFLNEYKEGARSEIRIIDLLQMSSGIDFGESYGDPFGFMAKTYYGEKLYELTIEKEVIYGPSEVWKYQGGNTLLLSFILEKACGKTLSEFFSEHIWDKVGAERNALWTINDEGREKAYCCFYSNARDFAKIGKLVLDSGYHGSQQIIDPRFFQNMTQAVNIKNEKGELIDYYGWHWWLTEHNGNNVVYARGILGQYIVIVPSLDLVMVRLGHKRDPNVGAEVPIDLIDYLGITERIIQERHHEH